MFPTLTAGLSRTSGLPVRSSPIGGRSAVFRVHCHGVLSIPGSRSASQGARQHGRVTLRCQQKATSLSAAAKPEVRVASSACGGHAGTLTAVPQIWDALASNHGDKLAMLDPHHHPPVQHTFREVAGSIRQLAAGLQALGISKGDKVSLFSENSARWMITDQAVLLCGAVGAVRGVMSIPVEELQYILMMSESKAVIVQDAATLDRLVPVLTAPEASGVGLAIVLWGEPSQEAKQKLGGRTVLTYEQVMEQGASAVAGFCPPPISRDDLATLAYTSGTGGHPKGVMLTHGNLLYQLEALHHVLEAQPGQKTVSYLPPWHMYGRTLEYYLYSRGVCSVYTNLLRLKADLQAHAPDIFISVPLMLDNLYSKVMQALAKAPEPQRKLSQVLLKASQQYIKAMRVVRGTDLRYAMKPPSEGELVGARVAAAALAPVHRLAHQLVYRKIRKDLGIRETVMSGGGSLAQHLDDFYEIIGLQVLVGYGLTETSPVLTVRRKGLRRNVRGTIGPAIAATQLRIVDPETKEDVAPGEQGLIMAKGPGVMEGYHKNEEATLKAFPIGDSWFDTGDLGWMAPEGVKGSNMAGGVVITGRAKDTIVLTNGENIEPQPIEDAVQVSSYIKFCVLLGSGHRALGALIVPDYEALEERATLDDAGPLKKEDIRALVESEIHRAQTSRPVQEHIRAFEVVDEPFSVENGTLTRTMKPRRPIIMQKYRAEVERVEARLR